MCLAGITAPQSGNVLLQRLARIRAAATPQACNFFSEASYSAREAGGGRIPRKPGQVRKEAALAIRTRVVRQSLVSFLPPPARPGAAVRVGNRIGYALLTAGRRIEPSSSETRGAIPGADGERHFTTD